MKRTENFLHVSANVLKALDSSVKIKCFALQSSCQRHRLGGRLRFACELCVGFEERISHLRRCWLPQQGAAAVAGHGFDCGALPYERHSPCREY
jgi:hypothetical protein